MCTRLRLVNFALLDGPNEVLPHFPLARACSWMSGRWRGNYGMRKGGEMLRFITWADPGQDFPGSDTVKAESFAPLRNSLVRCVNVASVKHN